MLMRQTRHAMLAVMIIALRIEDFPVLGSHLIDKDKEGAPSPWIIARTRRAMCKTRGADSPVESCAAHDGGSDPGGDGRLPCKRRWLVNNVVVVVFDGTIAWSAEKTP
jgi:hypothetical protein